MIMALPWPKTVADVMTREVHFAGPLTQFKLLVRLIEENRISAVPIVDQEGIPIGVVSESDLLLKQRRREMEMESPLQPWRHRMDMFKAKGVVAADLMTSPAVSVPANTPVKVAAGLMHERNVKRLVVVDGRGRIAGIVSRADLLQVFLRSDEEIRAELVSRVLPALVPDDVMRVQVKVRYGVVAFSGDVQRKSDITVLINTTAELDGVVDVIDHLSHGWDDTKGRALDQGES